MPSSIPSIPFPFSYLLNFHFWAARRRRKTYLLMIGLGSSSVTQLIFLLYRNDGLSDFSHKALGKTVHSCLFLLWNWDKGILPLTGLMGNSYSALITISSWTGKATECLLSVTVTSDHEHSWLTIAGQLIINMPHPFGCRIDVFLSPSVYLVAIDQLDG